MNADTTLADFSAQPARLADTTVLDIIPRKGGAPFRVFIHTPLKQAPEAGWPVLYMTDGNAVIAIAVDAMRVQASYHRGTNVGDGVIVAIGICRSRRRQPPACWCENSSRSDDTRGMVRSADSDPGTAKR